MKLISSTRPRALALVAGLVLLQGCATFTGKSPGDRLDPWENWNRKVFDFNEKLDANVIKPVATVYSNVVPRPVRRGIDNFFGNAQDAWSAVNNVLQGKVQLGLQDMVRFGTNTIFGLAGVLDVASEMGLERHNEDFGQTLGAWGLKSGPYIVWPLLGPSTVRESIALPLDLSASPTLVLDAGLSKISITTLRIVNTRSNLLQTTRVIDDIALDKYTFVRDGYLQRRRSLVLDGEDEPDDKKDEPPASAPNTAPNPAQAPAPGPASAPSK